MVENRNGKKVLITPVTAEDLADIHIGDIVYLDGDLVTCRDVAHRRLIEGKRELPVDLHGKAILHAGPIVRPSETAASGYEMVSVGPTTSMRMEKFEKEFVEQTGVKVIVGKGDVIDRFLIALLSSGHILLEDVPGTGKTLLAKVAAKSIDGNFRRIQFTPDLLPSDLTGINFYNQKKGEFEFRAGAVFTNLLLADEINRATPRAQSSMLECMEEKQVSCDGTTYPLPQPFFVIATQNPVETQGTFPLPEAQLDRFMVKLSMGYPTVEEQARILARFKEDAPQEQLTPVADAAQLQQAQQAVRQVRVHEDLLRYIGAVCEKTRQIDDVLLGASPRAALALMRVCQACAAMDGRDYVTPEDVKRMAEPVLAHRMILRTAYGQRGRAAEAVQQALASVPVPTEKTDR